MMPPLSSLPPPYSPVCRSGKVLGWSEGRKSWTHAVRVLGCLTAWLLVCATRGELGAAPGRMTPALHAHDGGAESARGRALAASEVPWHALTRGAPDAHACMQPPWMVAPWLIPSGRPTFRALAGDPAAPLH